MAERILKVGTRTSPLALKQVEEAISSLRLLVETQNFASLQNISFEIVGIDTYGDKDKTTPISDMEGADFFTREIDEALLAGEIDFAVHSAKDLPDEIPAGLVVAAITGSIDPYDALVSRGNLKLDELKKFAKIGASSQRRKAQLKIYRPDFEIVDIRGNINERLVLLEHKKGSGPFLDLFLDLDAIIVASCALMRLGLENRISQRIPFEILTPHPLQGALAIEARESDKTLIDFLKALNGE